MKKLLIFLSIVVFLEGAGLLIYHIVTAADTEPLVAYVKEVMLGNVPEDSVNGKPEYRYYKKGVPNDEIEFNISIITAEHNFVEGYMDVDYSFYAITESGMRFAIAGPPPARWFIHKKNGIWEILRIEAEI